jgi:hypothetical protein
MAQHFDALLEEQRAEARVREEGLQERVGRGERELGAVRRALERAEAQAEGGAELVGGWSGWRCFSWVWVGWCWGSVWLARGRPAP